MTDLPQHLSGDNVHYLPIDEQRKETAYEIRNLRKTAHEIARKSIPWIVFLFFVSGFFAVVDIGMVFSKSSIPFLDYDGNVPSSMVVPLILVACQFAGAIFIFDLFYKRGPDWLRKTVSGLTAIAAVIMILGFIVHSAAIELNAVADGAATAGFSLKGLVELANQPDAANPITMLILDWAPLGLLLSHLAFVVVPAVVGLMMAIAWKKLERLRETSEALSDQEMLIERMDTHDQNHIVSADKLLAASDPAAIKSRMFALVYSDGERSRDARKSAEDTHTASLSTQIIDGQAAGRKVPHGAVGGSWNIKDHDRIESMNRQAADLDSLASLEDAFERWQAMTGIDDASIIPKAARPPHSA